MHSLAEHAIAAQKGLEEGDSLIFLENELTAFAQAPPVEIILCMTRQGISKPPVNLCHFLYAEKSGVRLEN